MIEGIKDYPENKVMVFNRTGNIVYKGQGYNNGSVVFNGRTKNGRLVSQGTYYYQVEIKVDGKWKHSHGFFVIKY